MHKNVTTTQYPMLPFRSPRSPPAAQVTRPVQNDQRQRFWVPSRSAHRTPKWNTGLGLQESSHLPTNLSPASQQHARHNARIYIYITWKIIEWQVTSQKACQKICTLVPGYMPDKLSEQLPVRTNARRYARCKIDTFIDGKTRRHTWRHGKTQNRTEVGPYVTAHVRLHGRTNVRTHANKDVRTQPRTFLPLW